jgi:uncharacterized repeat protein (TIGR04138 family)
MQKLGFAEAIEKVHQQDPRYAQDAYYFVREALDFSMKLYKKPQHGAAKDRHVTGQELLEGIRQYALQQFGPLALTVLEYWGIRRCEDFGEIVFNMVEIGILGKTERDSRKDFSGGYDFREAFAAPFVPAKKRQDKTQHPVRKVDAA